MSTANGYLTVRGINIDVVYKDIKNLHIGVYPPLGRVRVAATQRPTLPPWPPASIRTGSLSAMTRPSA